MREPDKPVTVSLSCAFLAPLCKTDEKTAHLFAVDWVLIELKCVDLFYFFLSPFVLSCPNVWGCVYAGRKPRDGQLCGDHSTFNMRIRFQTRIVCTEPRLFSKRLRYEWVKHFSKTRACNVLGDIRIGGEREGKVAVRTAPALGSHLQNAHSSASRVTKNEPLTL